MTAKRSAAVSLPEIRRAAIVATARGWIGTPYRHQASRKGVGCDCLGLVRGIWRELYGAEPEPAPPYSPTWAEDSARETMRDAARRHMIELAPAERRPGDVLLFRMRTRGPAKHAAIATDPDRIVHAYDGHAVIETAIPPGWGGRIAYAFSFPNLTD